MKGCPGRGAALCSVGLLLLLVVQNVYWLREINTTARDTERFERRTHNLWKVAWGSSAPTVNGRLAIYYLLAQRIEGATITLPPRLATEAWYFERVARLEVVVSDQSLVIDVAQEGTVKEASSRILDWCVKCRRRSQRVYRRIHFWFEPGVRDYVIAEASDHYYVLPAARYAEVAAR